MAFNWLVTQLDSIPTLDGMKEIIKVVHWRAQKAHTESIYDSQTELSSLRDVFIADTYGALSLEAPHEASFTPYASITKEMVESWLEKSLDCEAIETNLDIQIANFLYPSIVAYALPWNQFENI
jgi:hypothetical protein